MQAEEKVVEAKNCTNCSKNFNITNIDLEFYKKISPDFAWKKLKFQHQLFVQVIECKED